MLSLGARVDAVLERLHARSRAQDDALSTFFAARVREGVRDWREFDSRTERFMSDKLVALDPEKAALCYHLCRGVRARRVVEVGTSFGVSTLYLAAAVRDNGFAPGEAVVIGTEHEPEKARAARAHFEDAGLGAYIDLREGDLRETLADIDGPIDFVLMDIWTPMVRPAIERLGPHLRSGAMVVSDNTTQFRDGYRDFFAYVADPTNGLRTLTLPFPGGLELTVRA